MNVMAIARSIGLMTDDGRQVSGTIDEEVVLASLSALAAARPGNDDLCADAAMRVRLARSAGVVHPDMTSVLHRSRNAAAVRLRYRSEMADVFTDLAIDIGLRDAQSVVEAGGPAR